MLGEPVRRFVLLVGPKEHNHYFRAFPFTKHGPGGSPSLRKIGVTMVGNLGKRFPPNRSLVGHHKIRVLTKPYEQLAKSDADLLDLAFLAALHDGRCALDVERHPTTSLV